MKRYVVMRTHSSPTAKQELWKVMTRPIADIFDARAWKRYYEKAEKNPRHEYFIIEREYDF